MDAIVIGAGIMGCACAAALTREGCKVTVLEQEIVAGGTTAAGMGHLVVMDDSPPQLALSAYSLKLWRDLAPDLPRNVELEPTGTLWIAEDDAQMAALRTKRDVYTSAKIRCELIDAKSLRSLEPSLREGLAGALRVVDDCVVYPPTAALALLARAAGARVEHKRVTAIGANSVTTSSGTMRADVIVNAAGARAPELTPGLPIVPRKGHLAITDRYPGFVKHQIVETGYLTSAHEMTAESVAFNVQPRRTGQVLIGSSRELVGWDATINRAILARMLSRATEFMPAIQHLSIIRTWTGFRPAPPDSLPLIGAWPSTPGLFIAAGHEGLGITTATATGELVAALAMGKRPAIDPAPYAPTRALQPS
jgi:glycine/D-amino acid oxidase-like deaminating enzyme